MATESFQMTAGKVRRMSMVAGSLREKRGSQVYAEGQTTEAALLLEGSQAEPEFHGWRFFKSLVYETMPMYTALPFAYVFECWFDGRSWGEAWRFLKHRGLVISDTFAMMPPPVQVFMFLLPSYCLLIAIYLWNTDDSVKTGFRVIAPSLTWPWTGVGVA